MSAESVEQLRQLVREIEVAMMTTRRADGHRGSRRMALQKGAPGADLWFVAARGAGLVEELEKDPHLNLAFYKDRTREYVSVCGTARMTQDRELIRMLWAPDWKVWFGDEGGERDGSAEDPRLMLVGVTVESARFLSVEKPQVVVLVEYLKGMVTGKRPEIGEVREVRRSE